MDSLSSRNIYDDGEIMELKCADIPGFPGYRAWMNGTIESCWKYGRKSRVCDTWKVLQSAKCLKGNRKRYTIKGLNNKWHHKHGGELVLIAFIGPKPRDMEVCHNDGNAANDCLSNLRWDTHQSNMDDRKRHGTTACGERSNSKLKGIEAIKIKKLYREGMLMSEIAKLFNVDASNISRILSGQRWQHLLTEEGHEFAKQGHRACKLTSQQVLEIRYIYEHGNIFKSELAKIFNITAVNVGSIVNGKTWKHLLPENNM